MKRTDFKKILSDRISAQERELLVSSSSDLYISDFNREVCRRIFEAPVNDDDQEIDERAAEELEHSLQDFLSEYMSDHPDAHKWIILACLELTFVEELPMHPQTSANWVYKDGKYFCPSVKKDSVICRYCACKEMD